MDRALWYDLRYDLSYFESYHKSCGNLENRTSFLRRFPHDLWYDSRYDMIGIGPPQSHATPHSGLSYNS